MASDKEFAALARMVLAQKLQVEAASMMLASQARLLSRTLKKCDGADCEKMALLKHAHADISMCQRCAAKAVVTAARLFMKAAPDDVLNPVRGTLMREEDWHHLPDAREIQHVQDYLDALDDHDGHKDVEGMN